MKAVVAALLVLGLAPGIGHAQPMPQETTDVYRYGRGGTGGGINNRVSSDPDTLGDIGGTLNLEVDIGFRVENVTFSWYSALALREFQVIGDFYKRISEERGKELVYGYLFGWLAGTDLIYSGPSVGLRSRPTGVAVFAQLGMGPMIFIDPRDPDATIGYGEAASARKSRASATTRATTNGISRDARELRRLSYDCRVGAGICGGSA